MNTKPQELEERLIDFAVCIIEVAESLPGTKAGNHIASQLLRSGTSPAPNYGEARGAESKKDFVHKMKIALKELRESLVWLRVIERKPLCVSDSVDKAIIECNELVSIFVASVKTADEERRQTID